LYYEEFYKRLDPGSQTGMTRFYSLVWFVSELAERFQKTGSRVAARDDTVCGLVGVVSGLYAVMWLEKTGSRVKARDDAVL
jgi:hypothetical protein